VGRPQTSQTLPAYARIEKYLRSLIEKGDGRSSPLPAEPDLAVKFKVSRMTARQAYQGLVNSGVIERFPGVGSFVTTKAFEELPITGAPDFSAWIRSGARIRREVLKYTVVVAPPEVAKALRLRNGTKVTYLERLRTINGVPSFDIRYMPFRVHERISKEEIERISLAKSLALSGLAVASGQVEIDAHPASAAEAKRLGVKIGHPILERRIAFGNREGRCHVVGTSWYPGGKAYVFRVQFHQAEAQGSKRA
jgi:GntR family transcriptional regulator